VVSKNFRYAHTFCRRSLTGRRVISEDLLLIMGDE
jgi:hypothetical protein